MSADANEPLASDCLFYSLSSSPPSLSNLFSPFLYLILFSFLFIMLSVPLFYIIHYPSLKILSLSLYHLYPQNRRLILYICFSAKFLSFSLLSKPLSLSHLLSFTSLLLSLFSSTCFYFPFSPVNNTLQLLL